MMILATAVSYETAALCIKKDLPSYWSGKVPLELYANEVGGP